MVVVNFFNVNSAFLKQDFFMLNHKYLVLFCKPIFFLFIVFVYSSFFTFSPVNLKLKTT